MGRLGILPAEGPVVMLTMYRVVGFPATALLESGLLACGLLAGGFLAGTPGVALAQEVLLVFYLEPVFEVQDPSYSFMASLIFLPSSSWRPGY